MIKNEIVEKLQELIGVYSGTPNAEGMKEFKIGEPKVSKTEAGRIWEGVLELIIDEVKDDGNIKFGNLFKVFKKRVNARMVRNPKTGEKKLKEAYDKLGVKLLSGSKSIFE